MVATEAGVCLKWRHRSDFYMGCVRIKSPVLSSVWLKVGMQVCSNTIASFLLGFSAFWSELTALFEKTSARHRLVGEAEIDVSHGQSTCICSGQYI